MENIFNLIADISALTIMFALGFAGGMIYRVTELRRKKMIKGKFGIYSFIPYNNEVEKTK